jgi:hypothetical protein
MDLKKYQFPTNTNTPKDLLQEAKDRGFYNGYSKYNKMFGNLFFSGGSVEFKKGIDEDFRKRAWGYLRSFIQSWNPKHEEKEAICALILSEVCEPELTKENSQ